MLPIMVVGTVLVLWTAPATMIRSCVMAETMMTTMTTIPQLQGRNDDFSSPYVGQDVVGVRGIVTAIVGVDHFYLQDPVGDGDDTTSDAILVVVVDDDVDNPIIIEDGLALAVGDEVAVNGRVEEYVALNGPASSFPITRLVQSSYLILTRNNPLPAPILIGGGEGLGLRRWPPTQRLADSLTFWAALESMRVTLLAPLRCVAPTNEDGKIFVAAVVNHNNDSNADDSSLLSPRGTLTITGDGDFNPERIQIQADAVSTVLVDVGTTLGNVTGIVRYAHNGNFEIVPTAPFSIVTASLLKPTTTTLSSKDAATSLLIGTYNVLGSSGVYDNEEEEQEVRIANANIIAIHMNGPDIVALQEIRDDSGASDDGTVSAQQTLAALVAAISDIDPNLKYKFIDNTFLADNTSGGEPGANIRTAFLYNPERIAVSSVHCVVDHPENQQTDPTHPFYRSRLPLAATFTFLPNTDLVFEVINNHWTAKSGSAASMGTRQPFEELQEDATVNGGLMARQQQSAEIQKYIADQQKDQHYHVIVLGNLNEFAFVSPVADLGDGENGLTILTNTLPAAERYSTIYQGNAQALDHILVSTGLTATAEYVHVNVEFAHWSSRAFTHDPMVALIQMPASRTTTTTTTAPVDNDDGPSMALSVGATVGGLCGLVALAAVAVYLCRRRPVNELEPLPRPIQYEGSDGRHAVAHLVRSQVCWR